MNPRPSSDGYAEIDLTSETRLKCAAVLIPLLRQDDEWHLLFTRRTDKVESHKGQVSFPGGGCDEGETTPEETALREANEEVGIDPQKVRVLGTNHEHDHHHKFPRHAGGWNHRMAHRPATRKR